MRSCTREKTPTKGTSMKAPKELSKYVVYLKYEEPNQMVKELFQYFQSKTVAKEWCKTKKASGYKCRLFSISYDDKGII
jgi:hypothetical protein